MPDSRKIIRNAYILPCDTAGTGGIGTVTIQNDRIVSVTYGHARQDEPLRDVEVIDGAGKVLLPGFIDLHTHGESVFLDLFAGAGPRHKWREAETFAQAEDFWSQHATTEDLQTLYTAVCFLALRSGVTYLGEFGIPGSETSCVAATEAFTRADLPGMLSLHNAEQVRSVLPGSYPSLDFAIALPPAEELTTYNLQTTLRLSDESGYPILSHLGETDKEIDILGKNFRKRPVELLEEFGMLRNTCFLIHVHTEHAKDLTLLKKRSLTPIVSLAGAARKGIPAPPVSAYRSQDIPVAICTDWGPFSHWNGLRRMYDTGAAMTGGLIQALPLLRELTAIPAQTLGKASDLGTIEPGKSATLQLIHSKSLELQAALNVASPESVARAMVQRVSTSDVSDVMVRGEFSVREGTILTYSEEDLLQDIQSIMRAERNSSEQAAKESQAQRAGQEDFVPANDDLGDEGFRIIRRERDLPAPAKILPLEPDPERTEKLPKKGRRIFGEDDL
jgi:5-methylthioadenosine/S-adenosylhomocysteine deaminase